MNPLKFIPVAEAVAGLSKYPTVKVGAVILDDDCNILSVGFNGFPRGVNDDQERYATKEYRNALTAHAEMNAIAQAARKGVPLAGSTILVTALYPCSMCARMIVQAGIKRVYAPIAPPDTKPKWHVEAEFSRLMFTESGVQVIEYQDQP